LFRSDIGFPAPFAALFQFQTERLHQELPDRLRAGGTIFLSFNPIIEVGEQGGM